MIRADDRAASNHGAASQPLGQPRPKSLLSTLFRRMTGDPIETSLSKYRRIVEGVKALDLSRLTDAQLRERMGQIRASLGTENQDLSLEAEIEIYACVCRAVRRTLGLNPFDGQVIAGAVMARGCIAELPTGEGKTLAAVFTACLRALSGKGVHVLTFNDYLARRDAAWMGPVYRGLDLSVGCVQEGMSPAQKREAYACDVTYAAAKEAGFDFLRDQIAYDRGSLVHRRFNFAVADEADSILIDEARIPLVISGAEGSASWDSGRVASLAKALRPGRDYETDDEHRNVFLTEAGIERTRDSPQPH